MTEIEKLKKEIQKLKKENANLKRKKKFGLVWEEREREHGIDDGEYYPYLEKKGDNFGFENWESSKNILIEGDNYHALEILQYTHREKIDVIYIDPPYNTGKKKEFRYGDRWIDENDGYRHSYWLSFMSKRLKLSKYLLSKNGVMFINIDANEFSRLHLLCEEIFGENKVEMYIWDLRDFSESSFTKTASHTVRFEHEYIVACFKKLKKLKKYIGYRFIDREDFKNIDNDPRGDWMSGNISRNGIKSTTGSKYFTITTPTGVKYTRNWTITEDEYLKLLKDNRIYFAKKGNGVPRIKIFKNEPSTNIQSSIFSDLQTSITGKNELKELFDNSTPFDFPKPTLLIKRLLGITMQKDSIILDFFAGTGTTGHALMDLINNEKSHINSNAKYILVTNNENNICEDVCYQRLLRANNRYNYKSNLEYLKIKTLKYDSKIHSELDIKEFMIDKLTEIIKVKEMCFSLKKKSEFLYKFDKKDKEVYILQDIYNMSQKDYKQAKEILSKSEADTINIYILALQNHQHYERKISGIDKKIIFEPLPENFLKLLRRIQRKKRR